MIRQLKEVNVFKELDDRILENIMDHVIIKDYQTDEIIFLQDKISEFVYIIISGSVDLGIFHEESSNFSVIYNLYKNDIFGEEAYYEDRNILAAKCAESAVLFQMRVKHFRSLVNKEQDCMMFISKLLAQKYKLVLTSFKSNSLL